MNIKPHVFYGATVYRSFPAHGETEVKAEKQWTCTLLYNQADVGARVSLLVPPMGQGASPREACEAFDKLWNGEVDGKE